MAEKTALSTLACIGLLLFVPGVGLAQQPPTTPLSLIAAVELAVQNYPAMREARARAVAASDGIVVARTAYLPRLDFLWQSNRATRNNILGLLLPQVVIPPISGPVLGGSSLDSVWGSAAGTLLSWEPLDFGQRGADVALARAQADLASAQVMASQLDVAAAAADRFLTVLATEATAEAVRSNVERLEVFAETVRILVVNQLRAGAELSRAQAELAAARNQLSLARQEVKVARAELAASVGIPGTDLTLDPGRLLDVPDEPPKQSLDPGSHPRAAATAAEMETLRARDRVLDRSYFPHVNLQAVLYGRGSGAQVDGRLTAGGLGLQVPNWAVGVSMTFPSLEVFSIRARRRVEVSNLEAASAHHEQTLQDLRTEEARARARTEAAFEIAAHTPVQLQAARDTETQARARYDTGLTSVIEVAEAQRLLAQAEAEDAVARLAAWRTLLVEATIRGELQPFLSRTLNPQSSGIK